MTNTVQCKRPWPWPHAQRGDIRNEDSLLLGKYLTDSYGLPAIPRAALDEAIQTVAHVQRFHPLRDWLVDLQWDGKSRIDKWLVHALGEPPAWAHRATNIFRWWAGSGCWAWCGG